MLKVNNKDTRKTLLAYYIPYSSVSIVTFQQVNTNRGVIPTSSFVSSIVFLVVLPLCPNLAKIQRNEMPTFTNDT